MNHLQITTNRGEAFYRWSCSIDRDFYRQSIFLAAKICAGIAVFILAYGAWLSVRFGVWSSMLIVALSDGVFLLIAAVVCWLFDHFAVDPQEVYEMTEIYIKTGTGKSAVYFDFNKARKLTITKSYLELKGRLAKVRVYAPEEDMPFVRDYIMNHIPGEAEVQFR